MIQLARQTRNKTLDASNRRIIFTEIKESNVDGQTFES